MARHEAAVLTNRIAAHRRFSLGHPLAEEFKRQLGRCRFRHGTRANAIDQARASMGASIPLVHRIKRLGRLVDRQHRAFRQHGQVRVSDDSGDFNDAMRLGDQPGHLHIDPNPIVVTDRHYLTPFLPDASRANPRCSSVNAQGVAGWHTLAR